MKKGVENFKRRTWDAEEYTKLAHEREDKERSQKLSKPTVEEEGDAITVETSFGTLNYADANAAGPAGKSKAYLDVDKARGGELNLERKVGKVEKVEGSRNAGYHCTLCDRVFQDSNSLLDHINGREHQSRLGFSLQLAPVSQDKVKSRLAAHIAKASNNIEEINKTVTVSKSKMETIEELAAQQELERVKELEEKKRKRKEKRRKVKTTMGDDNDDIREEPIEDDGLSALGFASFGGS